MVSVREIPEGRRKEGSLPARSRLRLLCDVTDGAARRVVVFTPAGVRYAVHRRRHGTPACLNNQWQGRKDLAESVQPRRSCRQALSAGTRSARGTNAAVECQGTQLFLRCAQVGGQCLLFLETQETTLSTALLKPLRLTPREAEVLAWASQGKSNNKVGSILGLSARTVGKHLEHIYAKLGVESRTAAARRAFEVAVPPPRLVFTTIR